jgi:hypothetical protein
LKVYENSAQREMFELKKEEVTEDCEKRKNVELHNLYFLPLIG